MKLRSYILTIFAFTASGLVIQACSGSAGPAGAAGPGGSAGPAGPGGSQGDAGTTTVVVLSARAKAGLDASPVPLDITGLSSAAVEKLGYGSYLVNAIGACNDCHASPSNPFAGGRVFDLGGGNFVHARNITPGGPALTEADFVSALQNGTDPEKKTEALLVMPWLYYRWMTVSDLKAMYAYLQAIPPVTNLIAPDGKGSAATAPIPLPAAYADGDADPIRPDLPPDGSTDPDDVLRGLAIQPLVTPPGFGNSDPPLAPVAEQALFGRGSYLVNAIAACSSCHTNPARIGGKINTAAYLSGGQVFKVPFATASSTHTTRTMSQNLTGATHGYYDSFSAFLAIFDQGIHSTDPQKQAVGWPMPWKTFRNMVPEDQEAIYTYILNVPRRTGANDKETTFNVEWCAKTPDCTWNAGETCSTLTNECIGQTCAADPDCYACQTCVSLKCAAPAMSSSCLANGI